MWKETPIPIYFSVYLFNWTNSGEVLKNWKIKPIFEECGPYVFSEHHIRVNIKWNNNGTITYQQKRIWHFLPEQSNGTLQDNITNLNVVATVSLVKVITTKISQKKTFYRQPVIFYGTDLKLQK